MVSPSRIKFKKLKFHSTGFLIPSLPFEGRQDSDTAKDYQVNRLSTEPSVLPHSSATREVWFTRCCS